MDNLFLYRVTCSLPGTAFAGLSGKLSNLPEKQGRVASRVRPGLFISENENRNQEKIMRAFLSFVFAFVFRVAVPARIMPSECRVGKAVGGFVCRVFGCLEKSDKMVLFSGIRGLLF